MKKILLMALPLAFAWQGVYAQEVEVKSSEHEVGSSEHTFSMSGQIRPRFEYRNGAYAPLQEGVAPAILVNNRLRLNMDYLYEGRLGVHISLQNVNVWGQAPQVQSFDRTGGLSVFEAYASLPLAQDLDLRIGRQAISLDDERIFGALDWHPAGRAHDAINLNWRPAEKWQLRSFFAYNQADASGHLNVNTPSGQHFSGGQDYQHMETLHAHYTITETQQLSFLFANLGYRTDAAADQNTQTFGLHYTGKSNALSYGATAYMQTGKNAGGADKEAFLLAANVGYRFAPTFALTAGVDYLSGNSSDDTSGKDKIFNPFSGTNHKFYGFMDYYYVGFTPTAGLLNPYLVANVRVCDKGNLSATYHYFHTAGKIALDGKNKTASLGSEIDLVYTHKINPYVSLQAGYSTYFTSQGVKTVKTAPNARGYQDWLWCSLNINPKFFSVVF